MSTEERDKKAYEYAQSCKFGEWELNGYVEFAYRAGYDSRDSELAALTIEKDKLLQEKEQWEPEWNNQAEANAAGYNQAQTEIAALKEMCEKAELLLKFPQSEKEAQLRAENARLVKALKKKRNSAPKTRGW